MEVLTDDPSLSSLPASPSCKKSARELRTLLTRSLAVNHPVTFFRAACLMLQVPKGHPALTSDDLFCEKDFSSNVVMCAMRAIGEALKDRRELRATEGGD